MGYRTVVLEPDRGSPAGAVADVHLVAAYDDEAALRHLAPSCAVVTTEFENPPARSLAGSPQHTLVRAVAARPSAIAQDRRSREALPRRGWASRSRRTR